MKLHLTGLLLFTLFFTAPHINVYAQERATQLKGPKDATDQYSGLEYGPIDAQDTLWRIAERYRQNNNLTVYQVMAAIYELNPNAFEQQNLNLLVEGATLKLPSERYIARISPQQARIRAERDDREFAELLNQPGSSVRNIKPPSPLVNQNDLTQTQSDIERKITRLDAEQTRQFDELRMQFAASLENVEALLNENRKLYDRVDQVNGELESLRGQVEGDVKQQLDTQVALQEELLAMMRAEQAQREAEKNASFLNALMSPITLIIATGLITLLLVVGLIVWLLKRKPSDAQSAPVTDASVSDSVPVPDNELDDLATAIAPDLDDKAELSDDELFNDDDLLDDVLTSELEDSLDSELETFADLEDDMLVPDDDSDELFEAGADELDQNELDSLFDDDDLSDKVLSEDDAGSDIDGFDLSGDDDDVEGIDLDADLDDDLNDGFTDDSDADMDDVSGDLDGDGSSDGDLDDFDIDDILNDAQNPPEETPASDNDVDSNFDIDDIDDILAAESALPDVDDEDDKPEISIDDLLDEHAPEPSLTDELDSKDDLINEEMIDKLDDEINQQNNELDKITDDLLNEIEQIEMMGGLDDEDEEADDAFWLISEFNHIE